MRVSESFTRILLYCEFQDVHLGDIFAKKITSGEFELPFRAITSSVFESSMIATHKNVANLSNEMRSFLGNPVPPGVKIYVERGRVQTDGAATVEQVTIVES